jgi:predicted MPP superfamily phosphohydrolase
MPAWCKKVALGTIILLMTLIVWGNRIEPRRVEWTHIDANIPHLPASWRGQQIAFIADMQVGIWLGNDDVLDKIVKELVKRQPLAVLIGGDFIYHPTDDDASEAQQDWDEEDRHHTKLLVERVVSTLKPLTDHGIQVFAVLGNHDYSMHHVSAKLVEETAVVLTDHLRQIGVQVLHNQVVQLTYQKSNLALIGVAPHYPNYDDVQTPLKSLDAKQPRLAFMHNANSLSNTTRQQIPFAIAGHTHGGQVRIPGFPNATWMSLVPHTPDDVKGDGWIPQDASKPKLYVNRGIGFSTIPIRIHCRPEVTIIKLQ